MRKGPIAGDTLLAGWGLRAFTRDTLERLHAATLDVMQTTGLLVACDEALQLLERAGCRVNAKTRVVRFPSHLVNQALAQCPGEIFLAGRDPRHDFSMGGRRVGFTTFGTGVLTEDPATGRMEASTKADLIQMARLADALEHVDILTPPVACRDTPDSSCDLHSTEACLINSGKHLDVEAEDGARCRAMIEMAAVIAGDSDALRRRPIISFGVCPTSPLQIIREAAEVVIEAARHGLPINILSMAMAGASSPISLSGTLVTHNAEVLAGVVLAQAVNPGCPVIYGSSTTTFDMRHGTAVVGVPEMAMLSAGAAELANFYGLPSYVAGG